MRTAAALLLVAWATIAACGPIDPRIAADQCEERARQASGPFGEVQVGGGTRGARGSVEVGITSDFIRGRDPYEVYDTCVRDKTGQGPIRPLSLAR